MRFISWAYLLGALEGNIRSLTEPGLSSLRERGTAAGPERVGTAGAGGGGAGNHLFSLSYRAERPFAKTGVTKGGPEMSREPEQ